MTNDRYFREVILINLLLLLSSCSLDPVKEFRDFILGTAGRGLETGTDNNVGTSTPFPSFTVSPNSSDTGLGDSSCLRRIGSTQRVRIYSEELQDDLFATIYLPPCYDSGKSGGYPVIYLLHGQGMDDSFWPGLGITDLATHLIQAGTPPFIMVFPFEKDDLIEIEDSPFGEAIFKDLIPWAEARYSICKMRGCQVIGGVSRGGGWAIHLALTHPEVFAAVGAHSFAYYGSDLYLPQELLREDPPPLIPKIYIDRGEDDYLAGSIDIFEQNLTELGIEHIYKINPGAHSVDYWKTQVGNYLNWYVEVLQASSLK